MDSIYDVAIIGGGINGCGCAADAASRGLSVFLCEQGDLAQQTSSRSTKLIHGGLRYLEYYEFGLVKKALDERQQLLKMAPHLIQPIPFFIPYIQDMRPIWLIRLGLFIYDHLSLKNKLPRSTFQRKMQNSHCFEPLKSSLHKGFIYYDCTTDDARLTMENAIQACRHGATIATHTQCIDAKVEYGSWRLTFKTDHEKTFTLRAKSVINASGPWISQTSPLFQHALKYPLTLIKGSHIVVPQIYQGQQAYVLQSQDNRVVFVIPYHGLTMIGTTDVAYNGSLYTIDIDKAEIEYLLNITNSYFKKQLLPGDILYKWSGVRTLIHEREKSPSSLSRDYAYTFTNNPAPLVTLYSGKMTTYRQLARKAVDELKQVFPNLQATKTSTLSLPGATYNDLTFDAYVKYAKHTYYWLDAFTLNRYLHTYGTRTECFLRNCHSKDDLGISFTPTLHQVEVDYLLSDEWAKTAEDILFRRTKLGLTIQKPQLDALEHYILRAVKNR